MPVAASAIARRRLRLRFCRWRRRGIVGLAVQVCLWALAWQVGPVSAHTTRHSVLDASSVTVEFGYSDGSTMPYGEIKVFAPGQLSMPHQIGRTDAQGRFAFVPHQDGVWRLSARDEDGHAHDAEVEVTGGTASASGWRRRAMLFVSVFMNMALLALLLDRYRSAAAGGVGMSPLARLGFSGRHPWWRSGRRPRDREK